jgi:hypothetical protein
LDGLRPVGRGTGDRQMSYPGSSDNDRPKMMAVYDVVRFLTIYGTPSLLVLVGLYLVSLAFGRGLASGFRSLASLLFPVVIASFLYVFNRELLRGLAGASAVVGFLIGFVMGVVVMSVLQLVPRSGDVPLAELMTSGCFSVLVFSSVASPEEKVFTYYYGVLSGLLLYVIVRGVPVAS